jgi:hypothetical protein
MTKWIEKLEQDSMTKHIEKLAQDLKKLERDLAGKVVQDLEKLVRDLEKLERHHAEKLERDLARIEVGCLRTSCSAHTRGLLDPQSQRSVPGRHRVVI